MSNLSLWRNSVEPFSEFNKLSKLMDRMWMDLPEAGSSLAKRDWNPTCEAREDASHYYLKFDLPGVGKDGIKLDLHDDRLMITGERKEEKEVDDKDNRTHFSEMFYGSFSRSMAFPTAIDAERTEAKFDNGVLTIKLPKKRGAETRQITIQ